MLKVPHGTLDGHSDRVLRAAETIIDRLDRLEGELRDIRAGGAWQGQAQVAYVQAKTTWDTAMDEMVAILSAAGTGVRVANGQYAEADRRGAGFFATG